MGLCVNNHKCKFSAAGRLFYPVVMDVGEKVRSLSTGEVFDKEQGGGGVDIGGKYAVDK